MSGVRASERKESTGSVCRYKPHIYPSGKVSTCFYDTACGVEYVGLPMSCKCKKCDRLAVKGVPQ